MRFAKQKQKLELEQLHEENCKRLTGAHLVKLELPGNFSETNEDDSSDWLKGRVAKHERFKTKTISEVFGSTALSSQQKSNAKCKVEQMSNCAACKVKHPLLRCPVLTKKHTHRLWLTANFVVYAFNAMNRSDSIHSSQVNKGCKRKLTQDFLHGAERIVTNLTVSCCEWIVIDLSYTVKGQLIILDS